MFKCGEKCTGIRAAEAKLVREKICLDNAIKENDCLMIKSAAKKVKDTTDYMKIMEAWPPAVNLAIGPAVVVCRLRPESKRRAIMKHVEAVMETGINPITRGPLKNGQVTGDIIRYLICKHDHLPFVQAKSFLLTQDTIAVLRHLKQLCQSDQKVTEFLNSLMATA